ncbi:MAG TPA: hypothetical protein VF732_08255 [Nitrospira sp.]
MPFIASATDRLTRQTDEDITEHISRQIESNVIFYASQDRRALDRRLQELDREWDIERVLEVNAAAVLLLGLALGHFHRRRWYLLPTAVAAFLFQHARQGWCPPMSLVRRLGVRTAQEIACERHALKALRGDFSLARHEDNTSIIEPLQAVADR